MPTPEDFKLLSPNATYEELEDFAAMAQELHDLARLRLPDLNTQTRHRRSAPLGFIGELSRGIFGTATMDDVRKIRDTVNNLARNEGAIANQLRHSVENMVSCTRAADKRMSTVEEMVMTQRELLKIVDRRLGTNTESIQFLKQWITDMFLYRTRRTIAFHNLKQDMMRTKAAITQLSSGKFSDDIITDLDFGLVFNELKKVQSAMGDEVSFLKTNPTDYYDNAKFFAFLNGTDIWITLRLPVGKNIPADLYRVHTWNVPVYNGSVHSTRIQGLPEYAAAYGKRSVAGLSADAKKECLGEDAFVCPFSLYFKEVDGSSCHSSVWGGSGHAVDARCDFSVNTHSMKPSMKRISKNNVLVQDISSLTLTCGRQSKTHPGCHSCVLDIPCGCRIVANSQLSIVPTQVECSTVGGEVTQTDMVNFSVLKQFLNHSLADKLHLKDLTDNAKLSKIQFQSIDAHLDTLTNKDILVTKQMRDVIKEAEEIERQDNVLASEASNWNPSFIKTPAFGMNLFIIIVVVGVVVAFVYYKRRIGTALHVDIETKETDSKMLRDNMGIVKERQKTLTDKVAILENKLKLSYSDFDVLNERLIALETALRIEDETLTG